MLGFSVESRHENVQIGFKCVQMVDCLLVDFVHHADVEIVRVNLLRSDREDSVGDGNVHIGGLLKDAVEVKNKFWWVDQLK